MLLNITCYLRKCFNLNDTLYVEVRNSCPYYLYMSMEYTINEKIIRKQTPVFKPGKFTRLTFPSGALFVYIKIFNCSRLPPTLICAKYVKNYMSTCHNVTRQSASSFSCTEIPC